MSGVCTCDDAPCSVHGYLIGARASERAACEARIAELETRADRAESERDEADDRARRVQNEAIEACHDVHAKLDQRDATIARIIKAGRPFANATCGVDPNACTLTLHGVTHERLQELRLALTAPPSDECGATITSRSIPHETLVCCYEPDHPGDHGDEHGATWHAPPSDAPPLSKGDAFAPDRDPFTGKPLGWDEYHEARAKLIGDAKGKVKK